MDKLLEVLNKVKELLPPQAQVAIAGGAVRDTLLGIPFKDVDVIVLPNGIEALLENHEIVDSLLGLQEVAELHGFRETYDEEEGSDFNDRLHGVVKLNLCEVPVDILFQKDSTSFDAVVQGYDHVANMVYLTDVGLKLGTNLPFVRAMLNTNSGFNLIRDLRDSRRVKMTNLMYNYGDSIKEYLERIGG